MCAAGGGGTESTPYAFLFVLRAFGRTSPAKCVGTTDVQLFIDLCDNAYAPYQAVVLAVGGERERPRAIRVGQTASIFYDRLVSYRHKLRCPVDGRNGIEKSKTRRLVWTITSEKHVLYDRVPSITVVFFFLVNKS